MSPALAVVVVAVSSTYPSSYAPRFLITVAGTEFHEYSGEISDVVVDTTIDGANHCSFTLSHPFNHEQGTFSGLTWKTFEPGNSVTIALGHGEGSRSTTTVFKGDLETVRPEFSASQPPRVQVTGYGPLRKMMHGTNSNSWEKKTIGNIVSTVASDLDSITPENAKTKLARVFQEDQSDYQFVRSLANKYGFEFFESLGNGVFRPKQGGSSPADPVVELYYGESLESFSAEMKPPEHGTVEVRAWDKATGKTIVESASNKKGTGTRVYHIPVNSKAEAKQIATAKLGSLQIEGTGETFGIPSVVAGTVVTLNGLGSKFSNDYYITRATHRMGESGYRTSFEGTGLDV